MDLVNQICFSPILKNCDRAADHPTQVHVGNDMVCFAHFDAKCYVVHYCSQFTVRLVPINATEIIFTHISTYLLDSPGGNHCSSECHEVK